MISVTTAACCNGFTAVTLLPTNTFQMSWMITRVHFASSRLNMDRTVQKHAFDLLFALKQSASHHVNTQIPLPYAIYNANPPLSDLTPFLKVPLQLLPESMQSDARLLHLPPAITAQRHRQLPAASCCQSRRRRPLHMPPPTGSARSGR